MMKKLLYAFLFIGLIAAVAGAYLYKNIWSPNVHLNEATGLLKIPTGTEFNQLRQILVENNMIEDEKSFVLTSKLMKYDSGKIKSGLFEIKDNWSNRDLIQHLRIGKQKPVKLTFNNYRTIEEFVGGVSNQIEADSLAFLSFINSEQFLEENGINKEELLCLFLPNTYEVYWNTSIEKLCTKLIQERKKFWDANNRRQKADDLGLSISEVCTLAAIVEKETLVADEKSTVAGVYLNRLKRGMRLGADPTVVYAVGDFSIRRVLNKHLSYESPYNTYLNEGLPPGPIYMPDNTTIDAVLAYEGHNYLYFCAKPDNSGRHQFAKNLTAHNKNARNYHRWLNKRGIK